MPLVDLPEGAQLDAPQGTLVDLPQGAQLDTPQISGAYRWPALMGSYLAKGALEGAGAVGDLSDFLHRQFTQGVFDPLHQAITGRPANAAIAAANEPGPLSSASLVGAAQQAGAVNRPDLSPQTTGERYATAAAEGAGGTLPFLPLSAGSIVPTAARALTQGAAAGAGGEAAAEAFPNYPGLARASGGILAALAAGKGFNAANRLAGAATGASTPTLDAYRNLGVEPVLAGDVTGSPAMQMMQAYAAKSPGGAGRVHAASEHAVNQWGNALEDTADTLGNSRSLQEAGDALQTNGNAWLNQFKNANQRAWGNVDLQIPATTPVPVTNYAQTLQAVQSAMPNAPATAANLQAPLSRNLLNSLSQDIQKGPLTWKDVTGIRTRIGERLADPQLVGDTGYADLKRIYGALSSDLQATAAARGPQAQTAFNQANAVTSQGHDFIENVLSPIMKAKPEDAANALLNSGTRGGTAIQAIRFEMPTAADELAAYKLRDMGLANPGQQNAGGTQLSPGTFLTDQAKLSPQAADALFGADPTVAQRVGDLGTVAGTMKGTERFLNTSNTGAHGAAGHAVAALMGAPMMAWEGYHAGGLPGAIMGGLAAPSLAFGPSYLAGRLVTSPRLTSLLAAPPAVTPQSAGLLTTGAAYPPVVRGLLGGP